ncbi:hypothetical protein Rsub_02244 [Raphidocelis subcapitata]|uniref:Uncharacterized protein n=1 Tax=Raphidocelis subcapitata TaxID=307507 RepID=A0A2V0NPJ5_9CHLO|nr:hypothetical protein Rsub_02244 [Raphidocelis subcapitata]|eukprot:GBF89526.1 hypothetical protein Rsub_02244 [Raphidocelis subcapitata]
MRIAFVVAVLAALGLLGASLYKTIPGLTRMAQCINDSRNLSGILSQIGDVSRLTVADADALLASQGPIACWNQFWGGHQISFVLSCAGVGALLAALLTCCCFCCADEPAKGDEESQFTSFSDTAQPYDQYQPPPPPFNPYAPAGGYAYPAGTKLPSPARC